jgi:dethiobiotin synthase
MRLYVAATRQNDGKTMVSLGLLNALRTRLGKVTYMKPVGQQYIEIDGVKIDKDAVLMQKIYNLKDPLPDMSPVAIPQGFTENYILNGNRKDLAEKVEQACNRLSEHNKFVLIEGTGHGGVGSVFDMSNADVAKLLKTKVVLVACGGIGRPIDELMLNKAIFDQQGVEIIGVIINKVQTEKYKKINRLVRLGLKRKGLDVLGVIPFDEILSHPTMEELREDLQGTVLCGQRQLKNMTGKMVIGDMHAHDTLNYLKPGCLLITPGNRDDLILAALSAMAVKRNRRVSGIILTCGVSPHKNMLRLIKKNRHPHYSC